MSYSTSERLENCEECCTRESNSGLIGLLLSSIGTQRGRFPGDVRPTPAKSLVEYMEQVDVPQCVYTEPADGGPGSPGSPTCVLHNTIDKIN